MRIKHLDYSKYLASLLEEIKEKEIYSPLLLNNKTLLFPLASEPNKIFVISLNIKNIIFSTALLISSLTTLY